MENKKYSEKQKKLIFRGFFGKMSRKLSAIVERHISVKHTDDGLGCTDGKTVWLNEREEIVPSSPEEALFFMKGVTAHELGHLLFTDFSITKKKAETEFKEKEAELKIYCTLDNIVEDTSIEYWLFRTLKGEFPRALNFTIGSIFQSSPRIETKDSPMGQFIAALIQYGDVGLLKGEFTFPEAREIFYEVLPVYDEAIECPSARQRSEIVDKIFEMSRPLWEDEAKMTQDLIDQLKKMAKEHEASRGRGSYSKDASQAGGDSGESDDGEDSPENENRRRRREKTKSGGGNSSKKQPSKEDGEESGAGSAGKEKEEKSSENNGSDGDSGKAEDGKDEKAGKGSSDENGENKEKGTDEGGSQSEGKGDAAKPGEVDSGECGSSDNASENGNDRLKLTDADILDELNAEAETLEEEVYLSTEDIEKIRDEMDELLQKEEKAEAEFEKAASEDLPQFKINCKCDIRNVRCKNLNVRSGDNLDELREKYNEVTKQLAPEIRHLTNCLKAIIREDVETKEARTSGKINIERLSTAKRTARVFDRRVIPNNTNMAVFLALDESGSMCGRYKQVKLAAIAIAEACHNVKLPLYVMGFTADEQGADAVHFHYVKWKNTLADRTSLMSISARSNNFDGYSVRYGAEILKKRPEQKKLMIVISDGQPAARAYRDYSTGGVADTKDAVRVANKSCIVQGVAIGNNDTEVINEIYGGRNFIHVSEASELLTQLGNTLKKRLRQR